MFILQRSGPMLMRYFLLDFLHFELVNGDESELIGVVGSV